MYLEDSDIPTVKAHTPLLDMLAEKRLKKAESLFLPSMPMSVCAKAYKVGLSALVALQIIGLVVKLTGNSSVRVSPKILDAAGISVNAFRNGLRGLEEAGLVSIQSARGHRREITLLERRYVAWLLDPRR